MSTEPRHILRLLLLAALLLAVGLAALRLTGGTTALSPAETDLDTIMSEPVATGALRHPAEYRAASRDSARVPITASADHTAATVSPSRVSTEDALHQTLDVDEAIVLWRASGPANPWQIEGSGTLRATYPDGRPMLEGRFVDGKPDGEWTRWHPDGRLAWRASYQRGVLHGESLNYHDNGQLAERVTYDSGRAEGSSTGWHKTGQIREHGTWAAGQRHGTWRWYDAEGRLVREEEWRSGARAGPIALFDQEGNPTAEQERERRATAGGRYANLLRRIAAPDDKAGYGEFRDYGRYQPTAEYLGAAAIPEGYWVYVHPYWYVWGERRTAR